MYLLAQHMYIYIYIKEEILLEKILKDHCLVSCLMSDVWLWSIGNQWWSECCCTDSYFPFLQWTRMLTWTWLWGPQCLPALGQQARGVPLPGDWSVNGAIPQTVHTPTNKNVIYKLLLKKRLILLCRENCYSFTYNTVVSKECLL